MTHIIKKTLSKHQRKLYKKYELKKGQKYFYRVYNKAGEGIKDFDTKKDALKYSKKRRGI